jgi:hypothetical protein
MFGESTTSGSIGPSRRGLWVGLAVGCLLLATGIVLVSGTVDGLNFFGARLGDSTPSFSGPPKDDDARSAQRADRPDPLISPRPPKPASLAVAVDRKPVPAPAKARTDPKATPVAAMTPVVTPADPTPTPASTPVATPIDPKPTPLPSPDPPSCTHPGYAAVLEPATDPIGTALAKSLKLSELQARIIGAADRAFSRQDIDRIMAGDASFVAGRVIEGTLLVAQLRVHARRTVVDHAPVAEVGGTMELAIVRNNCGAITVQRLHDVPGRSVNETINDGMRGLGEIFKEKITDAIRRSPVVPRQPGSLW